MMTIQRDWHLGTWRTSAIFGEWGDRTSSRDEKAQGQVKIHGPPYAKIAKSLIQGQQSISQGPSEYVWGLLICRRNRTVCFYSRGLDPGADDGRGS